MINNENITDNNDISEFKILQIGVNRGENIELPTYNLSSECLKVTDIDVSNSEGVDKALKKIDNAIVEVNKCRSVFGSLQSRMESTSDVLADSIINIEGGLSNIMDADIAFEMAEVARSSVLIESSLALMAQSNNLPNDVLNILSNLIK